MLQLLQGTHYLLLSKEPEAEQLFAGYPFKDYQLNQMEIPKAKMCSMLARDLRDNPTRTLISKQNGLLNGIVAIRTLPWISRIIEARAASITHFLATNQAPSILGRMLKELLSRETDLDFIDCRVANGDIGAIHILEKAGFRFAGNDVFMARRMNTYRRQAGETTPTCRSLKGNDWPRVMELARKVHVHNRFMNDPRISREKASRIFTRYIAEFGCRNPYHGLVHQENGRVTGFIFYKWNQRLYEVTGKRYASLDFIGVDPEAQCRGIGHLLNTAALNHLAAQGADHVSVRTLGNNYPAMRILYKSGFKISSSDFHFHYWWNS